MSSTPPPPDDGDQAGQPPPSPPTSPPTGPPSDPYGVPPVGEPPTPGGYAGQPPGGYAAGSYPEPPPAYGSPGSTGSTAFGDQGYAPQGYPNQGYGPMSGGPGQPADLTPRFLARLIDYVLLFLVYVIISIALGIGSLMTQGDGQRYLLNAVDAIVTAALYLGYFTLMEARGGQTVGKMLLKLRTQGPDGSTPTLQQALRRNLFNATWILGVLPLLGLLNPVVWLVACIIIAVQISGSSTRQAWHDQFAGGTQVVRVG